MKANADAPDDASPKVSVVIVTYNRKDELARCLRAVQKLTWVPHEIIVWNNGSNDGAAEMIAHDFPNVSLHNSLENLGPTGGRNRAVAAATGKYIFLLDDDAWPAPDSLSRLAALAERHATTAICAANVIIMKNETTPSMPQSRAPEIHLCPTFCAGGALVRRKDFLNVGGFSEHLFRMGEEGDLALRLLDIGSFCVQVGAAHVYHLPSSIHRDRRRDRRLTLRNTTDMAMRLWPFPFHWLKLVRNLLYVCQYTLAFRSGTFLTRAVCEHIRVVARNRGARTPIQRRTFALYRRLVHRGKQRRKR